MSLRACGLLALSLLALGCKHAREGGTEVIVLISAEEALREQIALVNLVVEPRMDERSAAGAPVLEHDEPAPFSWPLKLVLVPKDDDAGRLYRVTATALDRSGEPLVRVRVLSGFVAGERRYVLLSLEDACRGVLACDERETCYQGNCVEALVDPDDFSKSSRDAPNAARLAERAQRDAGSDASGPNEPDAAERDADVDERTHEDSGAIGGNGGTGIEPGGMGGVMDVDPSSSNGMDAATQPEPLPEAAIDAGNDPGSDAGMQDTGVDAEADAGPTCVPACGPKTSCKNGPSGASCVDDSCDIHSGYAGDDACLLAPDPSDGFQIHVGPTDYTDSSQLDMFKLSPGQEVSQCWSFHTPNAERVDYSRIRMRARPGTVRTMGTLYNTQIADGGWGACRDNGTGTSSELLRTWLAFTGPDLTAHETAPENVGISAQLPPNWPAQLELHAVNTTEFTILREVWINVYYVKTAPTGAPELLRAMGGLSWSATPVAPHADQVYSFSCPIDSSGRVLWLQSTMLSHNARQSAWIKHAGGAREQIFEVYDWTAQRPFYFDSLTINPSFSASASGAYSGILNVQAGDTLQWECRINNTSDSNLTYSNQINYGAMCNLFGEVAGAGLSCVVP